MLRLTSGFFSAGPQVNLWMRARIIERSTFNPLNAPEKFHHDRKLNFPSGADFPSGRKINWKQIKSDTWSKLSKLCRVQVFVVKLNFAYRFDLSRFSASFCITTLYRTMAKSERLSFFESSSREILLKWFVCLCLGANSKNCSKQIMWVDYWCDSCRAE